MSAPVQMSLGQVRGIVQQALREAEAPADKAELVFNTVQPGMVLGAHGGLYDCPLQLAGLWQSRMDDWRSVFWLLYDQLMWDHGVNFAVAVTE